MFAEIAGERPSSSAEVEDETKKDSDSDGETDSNHKSTYLFQCLKLIFYFIVRFI